ncbi:MAG: methyltransferase domain-containing protein [Planctomycetota bacterium]
MATRRVEPELMDDPALDARAHAHALVGLARLNRIDRAGARLWKAMRGVVRSSPTRPWRVLDLAAGSGDLAIDVCQRARRAGIDLVMDGCDISSRAVATSTEAARAAGVRARFVEADVLRDGVPGGYDIVTCSLFMHHLDDEQATALLRRMVESAGAFVIVSDLRRSRASLAAVWLGSRLLSRSPVVRVDAIRSVRAAFTLEEFRSVAADAGVRCLGLRRAGLARFELVGERAG